MNRRFGSVLGWLCEAVALTLAAGGCSRVQTATVSEPPLLVTTTKPVRHRFRETVRVQGEVRAKDIVRVAARIPGPIEALWVNEGEHVAAGRPLFQTDREHLEHQLRMAEDAVRVAIAGRREAVAALEDAQAALRKAEVDYKRSIRMFTQDGAIPLDALELAEMAHERARAAVHRASAAVEVAEARVQQAESALLVAKRQLADSTICSPIAGVITRRFLKAGEYAAPGTTVLQIESTDRIEIVAWVSAALHGRVLAQRSQVRFVPSPGDMTEAPIEYVAPTVDARTRTFEVRASFVCTNGVLAPGRTLEVEIVVDEHEGWAVPASAVARRGDRATLWIADEGRARALEVRLGAEADDMVEIIGEGIETAEVIVEGRGLVQEGEPIRVATSQVAP